MPHIAITMYPGRDKDAKQALAKAMKRAMNEELGVDPKYISVSVEDIAPDKFDGKMSEIPADAMFIQQGEEGV